MRQSVPTRFGFTLIEVLIVISILGVLTTSGVFTLLNKLEVARDGKRKADIEFIRGGIDEYYEAEQCYPAALPDCSQALTAGSATYIASVPCDAKTKQPFYYETEASNCPQWYRLYALLENESDASIGYASCTFGCGPDCQYNYGISSSNTSLEFCSAPVTPTVIPEPTTPPAPTNPVPTLIPMPTHTPAPTRTPTPTPLLYACSPGGGALGLCEQYDDPTLSLCPKVFPNDPTCNNECGNKEIRCKNSSGKNKP